MIIGHLPRTVNRGYPTTEGGRALRRGISQHELPSFPRVASTTVVCVSGPQVVEGWHGAKFPKPLARTREYIDIIRQAGPTTPGVCRHPSPTPRR